MRRRIQTQPLKKVEHTKTTTTTTTTASSVSTGSTTLYPKLFGRMDGPSKTTQPYRISSF